MRKFAVLILALVALSLAFYFKKSEQRVEQAAVTTEDSLTSVSSAPVKPGEVALAQQGAAGLSPANIPEQQTEAPAMVFFPKSKIVASITEPAGADGSYKVIQTVETNMKERFVRVERTLAPDLASGGTKLLSEIAMVANQVLLQKPDSLAEATFLDALQRAGAIAVKPVGGAFLATFEARPEDPKALDSYIARVKEIAAVDITVEPNYIRKIL